jgi:hypothetical protein|tara:strand:- start:5011 stop:5196 length:186 start_codon:yes stop_codon:yes gene_type:complete
LAEFLFYPAISVSSLINKRRRNDSYVIKLAVSETSLYPPIHALFKEADDIRYLTIPATLFF